MMVELRRVELLTSCMPCKRSNQLSYSPSNNSFYYTIGQMKLLGKKFTRRDYIILIAGALIGVVLLLAVRFLSYQPAQVHMHANFAVYINGQREKFSDANYYEAVSLACGLSGQVQPQERAHMHDRVNDIVHIHDHGVTWGHFFQNLGWSVAPNLLNRRGQVYLPSGPNKLSFILNGRSTDNIANRLINSEDRLLINFGKDTVPVLKKRYESIGSTAHQYNQKPDPVSCAGSQPLKFTDRLKNLF
jgi:hypothetical protein